MSRSLHTLLLDVSPLEAVEYVLPLLSALAIDEGKCLGLTYLLTYPLLP